MTAPHWIGKWFGQTAVYWGGPVPDGDGGYTFDDPVEIACRWEDRQESMTDGKGEAFVSRAAVYSATEMVLGGYIYLGTLDDLASDEVNPQTLKSAYEIRAAGPARDHLGIEWARAAWL